MKIEEFITRLQAIQAEHPNVDVVGTDDGIYYDAFPVWSKRDNIIYVDGEE